MADVIEVTQSRGYGIDDIVSECRAVEGGEARPVADAEAVARGDAIQGGRSRPITQAEAISAGGLLMEWVASRTGRHARDLHPA